MKADTVRAFLDAADDLLAAQQQLMPDPLPAKLRAFTEAYVEKRAVLMNQALRRQPAPRVVAAGQRDEHVLSQV